MQQERRRYIRYEKLGRAFSVYGRKSSKVGNIKDISLGGLSFEYIYGRGKKGNTSQIDIFLAENDFLLYGLSCKVVYDFIVYVPRISNQFSSSLIKRRCGIRFTSLSGSNRRKSESFLESKKSRVNENETRY